MGGQLDSISGWGSLRVFAARAKPAQSTFGGLHWVGNGSRVGCDSQGQSTSCHPQTFINILTNLPRGKPPHISRSPARHPPRKKQAKLCKSAGVSSFGSERHQYRPQCTDLLSLPLPSPPLRLLALHQGRDLTFLGLRHFCLCRPLPP